jgi:hypothetical protein
MKKTCMIMGGVLLGAGAMYLFDPEYGRRRRARLRDRAVHASKAARVIGGATSRDVEHRLAGAAARVARELRDEPLPGDNVLEARVRARLGRLVSHPHAIAVSAKEGTVTLTGPVLEAEVEQLLAGVAHVTGVRAVDNRLEGHATANGVSALQGPGPKHVEGMFETWRRWTPAARLAAGLAGTLLIALSSPNRPVRGAVTGVTGMELLERALLGRRH